MRIKVSIVVTLLALFASAASLSDPDAPMPHWIGLIPSDFLNKALLEKDYSWNIPLYEQPDSDSALVGWIRTHHNKKGLYSTLKLVDSDQLPLIEPHIYESDYTYSPYFHLTILEMDYSKGAFNGWFKVQPIEDMRPVWGQFQDAFGERNWFIHHIAPGSILSWIDAKGKVKFIFVEHINYNESLLVRDEQPVDMWCGDSDLKFKPYTTRLIPKSEWIDEKTGRSRFNVTWTRGC